MAKLFRAHYNEEVRFSSVVECKKGSRCLIKDKIIIIIFTSIWVEEETRAKKMKDGNKKRDYSR